MEIIMLFHHGASLVSLVFVLLFAAFLFLIPVPRNKNADFADPWAKISIGIAQRRIMFFLFLGFFTALRLVISSLGFELTVDSNTFRAWAFAAAQKGVHGLYASDLMVDYPPVLLYFLSLIGVVSQAIELSFDSIWVKVLIGFFPTAVQLGFAYFAVRYLLRLKGPAAVCVGLFLFLLPHEVANANLFGQLDGVSTFLAMVAMAIVASHEPPRTQSLHGIKRAGLASIVFSIGVFAKPQVLLFAPVGFICACYLYTARQILVAAGAFLATSVCILTVSSGFDWGVFLRIVNQYQQTLTSYPYASLNAANVYALFGLNWALVTEKSFGPLNINQLGLGMLILAVVFCVVLQIFDLRRIEKFKTEVRKMNLESIFFFGGLLVTLIFSFVDEMHERYLYSAATCFVLSWLVKPTRTNLFAALCASLLSTFNQTFFLDFHQVTKGYHLPHDTPWLVALSFLQVAFALTLSVLAIQRIRKPIRLPEEALRVSKVWAPRTFARLSLSGLRFPQCESFSRAEKICVLSLTCLLAVLGFFNLGSMSSPQTFWRPRAVSVQTRAYALEKPVSEGRIVSFFGLGKGHYEFEVSADFFHWASLGTLGHENVFEAFSWKSLDLKKDSYETPIRYLRVKSQPKENDATALFEIGIIDSNTQEIVKLRRLPSQDAAVKIKTDSVDAVAHDAVAEIIDEITDEPHLIVTHPDFMNEMIFDEVYHVRSAYEEILGERITETTHPPFGKTLISAGISLVGLNPFGWRFAGTLAGVLMIPLLYGFARVLTGSAFIATLAAFFFSFDFMRYTQTRLATLDGLALFFILLTMICLVIYGRRLCDPLDASVRISKYGLYKYGLYRLVPLFFCGTFFGVGLATKWSVLYLAPVLVVCIFTFALTYALLEKNRALDQGLNEVVSAGFSNKVSRGVNWFLKDGLFTVFALLIWPAILYYLAFWLSHYRSGEGYSLKDFWDRQVGMYRYHSELVATHPFSSRFWEWPVMKRPLWIYSGKAMDDGSGRLLAKSIVSFGNPLLWWSAIPAFFWGAYKLVRKFELSLFVLLITITGLYLPWIIAPRKLTFIYHFFPIVPFMLLLLAWVISQQIDPKSIKKNKTWGSVPVMAFCSVTVLLFLAFFPVLNGLAVYKDYVSFYLRWFSSWIF